MRQFASYLTGLWKTTYQMKTNAHAYRRELRRPVSLISFEIFQISSDGNRAQKLYDLCPFKAANLQLFSNYHKHDSTLVQITIEERFTNPIQIVWHTSSPQLLNDFFQSVRLIQALCLVITLVYARKTPPYKRKGVKAF